MIVDKENLLFAEVCQLINEGMLELEYHYFATSNEIMCIDNAHKELQKPLGEGTIMRKFKMDDHTGPTTES